MIIIRSMVTCIICRCADQGPLVGHYRL